MNRLDRIAAAWQQFQKKNKPLFDKIKAAGKTAASWIRIGWQYAVKLKKVLLAIPVGVGAVILALRNQTQLPDIVGLDLQSDGTFSILIARELAVLGPVAITALCLLLMFGAKRTLTPWLVSVFSLAIPLLILVTNVFPA